MADDTTATDRFRQINRATDDELPGDTLELEELDIMATAELRQLLDPEAGTSSSLDEETVNMQGDNEDADRD